MQRADLIQTLTAHLTALDTTNTAALLDALRLPFDPQSSLRYHWAAFDHRKDQPVSAPRQTAATNAILILNGIFLQQPGLSPHWDLTLFLHCDFDISPAHGGTRDKAQINGSVETETCYRKR
ncbi:MAG: hypothetical protein SVR81_10605 [Chloroflexota bacterium]|nr:hypothetical protein [Chloroflexota bacterium]